MDENDVTSAELCDYLNWAYYSSVDLQNGDELEQIRSSTCVNYYNNNTNAVLEFNSSYNGIVATTFLQ